MSVIIQKPWGHEVLWSVTEKYVGKILKLNSGSKLSRQYHVQKDETIYVLSGKDFTLEEGEPGNIEEIKMSVGQSYRIKPGTVHRFIAGSESCTLLEVSTPELDDVVRIEDDYGRE